MDRGLIMLICIVGIILLVLFLVILSTVSSSAGWL